MTCVTRQSGLGAEPFAIDGKDLHAELTWMTADRPEEVSGEEMLALLEGTATLFCGDECHTLSAGHGVLIPAGLPRRWEVTAPVLVYRVRARS